MSESTSAYAHRAGISSQRVRELARQGKIQAHKEGRVWIVTDQERTVPSRRALSSSSQMFLLTFLSTRRFDHVSGHPKIRLASRVRALRTSDNPAALLRDYFGSSDLPAGRGGASIVRAAMLHKDEFVKDVLGEITLPENLPSPQDVARKISYTRALEGLTMQQAADRTHMALAAYRVLEQQGAARMGNITAMRALRALGAPSPSIINAKTIIDSAISNLNTKSLVDSALSNLNTKTMIDSAISAVNAKSLVDSAISAMDAKTMIDSALSNLNTKTMIDSALSYVNTKSVVDPK